MRASLPPRRRASLFAAAAAAAVAGPGLAAQGGCSDQVYKRAVERYVDGIPDRARRSYDELPRELLRRLVAADAELACLVDRDRGRSTSAAPSPACRCLAGLENWTAACSPWFQAR